LTEAADGDKFATLSNNSAHHSATSQRADRPTTHQWANGVFCYFGEGQKGDTQWVRRNAAIRQSRKMIRQLEMNQPLPTHLPICV
jgi:hypothetical protein